MPNVWTIHANGLTGGDTKSNLVGCHINQNAAGTAYQFTAPNINTVLATTSGTTLPTAPFTFDSFSFQNYTWDISVSTLTGGAGSNQAQGSWSNNAASIVAEQDGTFTAQAGSTVEDDPEKDASAASA